MKRRDSSEEAVVAEVERLLSILPTADAAGQAWKDFGEVIVCDSVDEMVAEADRVAGEERQAASARDRLGCDGRQLRHDLIGCERDPLGPRDAEGLVGDGDHRDHHPRGRRPSRRARRRPR